MGAVNKNLFDEAVRRAKLIAQNCSSVNLIFLDQWRRSREEDKWRLTYLGDDIGCCSSDCLNCPIFWSCGGMDDPFDENKLVTTLVLATKSDLRNYDGRQVYLNCKSLDQYVISFVNCFVGSCHNRVTMLDELDYVAGFKVVYSRDEIDLTTLEMRIKERIIKGCLLRYSEKEKEIFSAAVLEIGFPKYFVI